MYRVVNKIPRCIVIQYIITLLLNIWMFYLVLGIHRSKFFHNELIKLNYVHKKWNFPHRNGHVGLNSSFLLWVNRKVVKKFFVFEWVGDCCLKPNEQSFSYIMGRTSYIQWDDHDVHFVLDQHAELELFSASSLKVKQQSTSPDSEPTSLCSISVMLCA